MLTDLRSEGSCGIRDWTAEGSIEYSIEDCFVRANSANRGRVLSWGKAIGRYIKTSLLRRRRNTESKSGIQKNKKQKILYRVLEIGIASGNFVEIGNKAGSGSV